MQRLRSTWLALMGGALLVTLSVSAAFGAAPAGTNEGTRGQSIAAFVHELVFGSDEETDNDQEEEQEDDTEEDSDEDAEDAERQVPEEFANHGECVSEAAHDTEGFEEFQEAEDGNFGAWVSMHARYICWGLEPPGADEDGEQDEDATSGEDEEEEDSEASAKEQRKAERAAARAERKAEREAAKASRGHGGGRR